MNGKSEVKQGITVNTTAANPRQRFESGEHKEIGDKALSQFLDNHQSLKRALNGRINPDSLEIKLSNGLQLSAGEWVALADYYAIAKVPISGLPNEPSLSLDERKQRFKNSYNTLANTNMTTQAGWQELQDLRTQIEEEEDFVHEAIVTGKNVPLVIQEHADQHHKVFASLTAKNILTKFLARHLPSAIIGLTSFTRYLEIAAYNFDHFNEDTELAFEAGYEVAVETALEAYKMMQNQQYDLGKDLFVKAITQALYASHFATDDFAAGHKRVPRKALCNQVGNIKLGGALSLMMHNEDGDRGLRFTQKYRETNENWEARGDGCLYDADAEENHLKVVELVQKVIESIYDVYVNGQRSSFNFRDYLPKVVENDNRNHPPLFLLEQGKVKLRKPLQLPPINNQTTVDPATQITCTYAEDWKPIKTLVKLWFLSHKNLPDDLHHKTAKSMIEEVKADLQETDNDDVTAEKLSQRSCVIL